MHVHVHVHVPDLSDMSHALSGRHDWLLGSPCAGFLSTGSRETFLSEPTVTPNHDQIAFKAILLYFVRGLLAAGGLTNVEHIRWHTRRHVRALIRRYDAMPRVGICADWRPGAEVSAVCAEGGIGRGPIGLMNAIQLFLLDQELEARLRGES